MVPRPPRPPPPPVPPRKTPPNWPRLAFDEDALAARERLRIRLLEIERRVSAVERARRAQGGLSFPPAQGGELGLCETIEPLPTRVPWWKRDGFTAPMAALGLFAGGGLLVKLLTSL